MPYEVVHKSCWEYFHPDEIPFARTVHGRGVELDKAAVLNYCLVRHKNGAWIGCECVFTVVYDVLVACTSIYQRGNRSQSKSERSSSLHCCAAALLRYIKLGADDIRTSGRCPDCAETVHLIAARPAISHAELHLEQVLVGAQVPLA